MMRNLLGIERTLSKYRRIKESDNAQESIIFGTLAVIFAVVMVGISALAPLALKIVSESENIVVSVLGIILLLLAVMAFCLLLVHTVLYVVLQLKLNRKAISFVALIFLILAMVGSVLMVVLLV